MPAPAVSLPAAVRAANLGNMSDVTQILSAVDAGDPQAASQLLPLVYDELRKLAAQRMALEKPGQTLDATALVHEAYLRLVGARGMEAHGMEARSASKGTPEPLASDQRVFANRRHFFAAAAEAMRRILVEQVRQKKAQKRGGAKPLPLEHDPAQTPSEPDVTEVNDLLEAFAKEAPRKAELVKLRYFVGCTLPEAAEILGISISTAEKDWTYAKAWLRREWNKAEKDTKPDI